MAVHPAGCGCVQCARRGMGGASPLAATPDARGLRASLPSHATVAYSKDLITLVLVAVAAPWLLYHLLTKPSRVLAGRGPTGAV